jgi:dolichyl-phosphate-mannose-protein mannosyltransferase
MKETVSPRLQNLLANLYSPYFIAFAALIVRLGCYGLNLWSRPPSHHGDLFGLETVQIATSLATGKGFSSPLVVDSGPTAWLTPVFPYLLAGIFKIFGVATVGAEIAIKVIDCVFSSLVCVVLVVLGRRLSLPTVGALSAWVWAFLPTSITFATIWVWDTSLSALCMTLLLLLSYDVSDRCGSRYWAGYGAFWAFAALTNPALLSALPGLAGFSAYRSHKNGFGSPRKWLVALVAFLACMAPWIIRNEIVFKGQVAIRSNFGLEFWLGNNVQVADLWAPWRHPFVDPQQRREFLRLGEAAYMKEKQHLALEFIKSHPAEVFQCTYMRFMNNWTGGDNYLNDLWTPLSLKFRMEMLLNCAFSLLAFGGVWRLYRTHGSDAFPFVWILLVYPLVYYITHTSPRYRSPIDPCMAFLAVCAAAHIVDRHRSRRLHVRAKVDVLECTTV